MNYLILMLILTLALYFVHFTDKETEMQTFKVVCPTKIP